MPRLLSLDRSRILAATIHPSQSLSASFCATFRRTSGADPPSEKILPTTATPLKKHRI